MKLERKHIDQNWNTLVNYVFPKLGTRPIGEIILTDPRTEIPPTDLLPRQRSAFQPHIFTGDEIGRILATSFRPWGGATRFYCFCHYTIYGLLSVTGMRVGEALNLDVDDVDLMSGVITIRNIKFGKSRFVPLDETTRAALEEGALWDADRWAPFNAD